MRRIAVIFNQIEVVAVQCGMLSPNTNFLKKKRVEERLRRRQRVPSVLARVQASTSICSARALDALFEWESSGRFVKPARKLSQKVRMSILQFGVPY